MSLKDIVERPSASDRLWPKYRPAYLANRFWGLVALLIFFFIDSVFLTPATELTSVRLGDHVEDASASFDSRVFASGSNVGMRIGYIHGNWATLEVDLADRSGKEIRGVVNSCGKYLLRDERGDYYCAFQILSPGQYQFLVWLKGAVQGKYPFEVRDPAPQPVSQPVPQAVPQPVQRSAGTAESRAAPRKTAPVPGAHTPPPYPPLSVRNEEQGTSLLLVTIGTNGAVSACAIDRSSGFARLDDAACRHVTQNWKWPPPKQNGEPVILQTRVEINWQIKDAPGGAKNPRKPDH